MTLTDIRTNDSYPTRVRHEPQWFERPDPAVWGSESDGPIDADTLAAHEANGYSTVEGLLAPAEVQVYWQELRRLCADENLTTDERVITEKSSGSVRSIFDVHEISPLLRELTADPRVLDRARQLLGSEVYIHQSRVNYMPGFRGAGFYWHSDFETWHAEDGMPRPRAVSCSIALTDNYPFNGGLMLIPGSHHKFVQCVGETPEGNYRSSLQEQRTGVPSEQEVESMAAERGIEQFTGSAGSALWFDANILHGSGNNITPFPRSNIFLVFNSVDNALGEPYAARQTRPSFIAGRESTPITR